MSLSREVLARDAKSASFDFLGTTTFLRGDVEGWSTDVSLVFKRDTSDGVACTRRMAGRFDVG